MAALFILMFDFGLAQLIICGIPPIATKTPKMNSKVTQFRRKPRAPNAIVFSALQLNSRERPINKKTQSSCFGEEQRIQWVKITRNQV